MNYRGFQINETENYEIKMKIERCHRKVYDSYRFAFYELGRAFDKLKACIWWSIWFPIWCKLLDMSIWTKENSWQSNLFSWWSGKGRREWF